MQNAAIATEPSLIERIQHDGSRLRIQLIALYGAIYFAYPHLILRVPHQVMLEVRKGLFDGIDGLQDEKGQFPQDRKQGIKGLIGKYFDAMVEDFNTEKDPRAFNPRGDKTFQTFDKYITYAYRDDGESFDHFSSIELMLLQPLIDAQPTNIMLTLRDEAKLIFVA